MNVRMLWLRGACVGLLVAGCAFEARSGQFRCEEGACPAGLVCVAQRCVGPVDAAAPSDAPALSDAGAADAGPSCDADFCARFDQDPRVQAGFDVVERIGSGEIARVLAADAPSPPAVFESIVRVPMLGDTSPYHAARLSLQPSQPGYDVETPRIEMSFRVRVTEFVDNPGITLADVRYGASEHYIVLAIQPGEAGQVNLVYFFIPEAIVRPLASVEMNAWTDISIIIPRRSGMPGTPVGGGVTVEVDSAPTTLLLPPAELSTTLRFDVGLATSSPEGRLAVVQYDNVRITYREAGR